MPVPNVAAYEMGLTAFVICVIGLLVWAFLRSTKQVDKHTLIADVMESFY